MPEVGQRDGGIDTNRAGIYKEFTRDYDDTQKIVMKDEITVEFQTS